jgi:hypothetical protein
MTRPGILGIAHVLSSLAAIAVVATLIRALRSRPLLDRLALASLPFCAVVIGWQVFVALAIKPVLLPWSAARLVPAAALARGMGIYASPTKSAAEIGWVYPPGAAVFYLPVAWLSDPALATILGRGLSLIYYLAPVAWLLFAGTTQVKGRWLTRAVLFVTFLVLTWHARSLLYVATEVNADAPALGLAALAVGLVYLGSDATRSRAWLWAAAVIALASVWTKQLTAPISLVVLPLWALGTRGMRGLAQYAVAATIAGGSFAVAAYRLGDLSTYVFELFTIHLRHPWRFMSSEGIARVLVTFQERHAGLIGLVALRFLASIIPSVRAPDHGPRRLSDAYRLFFIAALVEFPFSLLAYIKVGGDDNNLAYCLYFLTVGLVLSFDRLLASGPSPESQGPRAWLLAVILAYNLSVSAIDAQRTALDLATQNRSWRQSRQASEYLRHHKGEAYFPWNPLEHLAVDGKLYHFEYGVYARDLTGFPLRDDEFRKFVPEHPRLVCYPPLTTVADHITLKYLREFGAKQVVPELPGWICFAPGEPPKRARSAQHTREF